MAVEELIRFVPVVIFLTLQQGITQTLAEDCGNEIHCFSPYTCCSTLRSCCYDNSDRDNFRSTYRLHVWNMWYFWFIVIFILMSCFGGCGYYRRRRIMAMQQQQMARRVHLGRHDPQVMSQSYHAYVGPAALDHHHHHHHQQQQQDIVFSPPSYSEIVNQPGYPSDKSDLPPYPGPSVITSNYSGSIPLPMPLNAQTLSTNTENLPKPPPYEEVVASPPSMNTPPAEQITPNAPSHDSVQSHPANSGTNTADPANQ